MRRITLRRTAVLGAVLALTAGMVSACGSDSAQAGGSLKIAIFPGAVESLPAYIASEKGYFKEAGLETELLTVAGGPPAIAAVASKSADLMLNASDNVTLAREGDDGQDFVAVSGNTIRPVNVVIARNGLPTPNADKRFPENLKDLQGRKIGVTARGASMENIMRVMLTEAGLDPEKDVTWIAVGVGSAMTAALKTGQVDAMFVPEPVVAMSVDVEKFAKIMVDPRTGGPEMLQYPHNEWWGIGANVKAKKDEIAAFQEAIKKSMDFITDEANYDEVVDLAAQFLEMDPAVAQQIMNDKVMATWGTDVSEAGLKRLWTFMIDLGLISEMPNYQDVVQEFAQAP